MAKKNSDRDGFPTLGEAIRWVIGCTGLMPQKHNQSQTLLGNTKKKALQTKLRRLSLQTGNLDALLEDIKSDFASLIEEATLDPRITNTINAVSGEVFFAYQNILTSQGSFLPRVESNRWLAQSDLLDIFVLSAIQNSLQYGVTSSNLKFPTNPDWWLPDFKTGKRVRWPLEKAFRWIYESSNTSQSRFHNPNNESGRAQQNFENVSRWFNRSRLPSWGELKSNLDFSMLSLSQCADERYQRSFNEQQQHNFSQTLLLARIATDVFSQIHEAYGTVFTKHLTKQLSAQSRRIIRSHARLRTSIETRLMIEGPYTSRDYYNFWHREVVSFRQIYFKWLQLQDQTLSRRLNARVAVPFTLSELKALLNEFDPSLISSALRKIRQPMPINTSQFMRLYEEGRDLRKHQRLTLLDIENYREKAAPFIYLKPLKMMIEWMLATFHVRNKEHQTAFSHYANAFELAKQKVGQDTYLLVNEFAESCAKNNNFREFRKLLGWSRHHSIQVRFLRDSEITDDNVRQAFELLKVVTYIK